MSVPSRLRFEILKRDAFKCAYCGATPPAVILQVDHIIPVSKGGPTTPENLVTSCRGCNIGKSNIPLQSKPQSLEESAALEKERFAQMQAYNEWLSERYTQEEEWFHQISDHWITLDGDDCEKFCVAGASANAVRRFIKLLPATKIIEAIDIAFDKFRYSSNNMLRYFCGICWHMIDAQKQVPPQNTVSAPQQSMRSDPEPSVPKIATPPESLNVPLEENGSLPRSLIAGGVPGPTSKALRGQGLGVG